MDDGLSPKALEQIRGVVREEVCQIVRVEVRSEVATQLQPVHKKLDALATKDQEDSDALSSAVVDLTERVETLEGFHGITHEPAEA